MSYEHKSAAPIAWIFALMAFFVGVRHGGGDPPRISALLSAPSRPISAPASMRPANPAHWPT